MNIKEAAELYKQRQKFRVLSIRFIESVSWIRRRMYGSYI